MFIHMDERMGLEAVITLFPVLKRHIIHTGNQVWENVFCEEIARLLKLVVIEEAKTSFLVYTRCIVY